MAKRPWNPSTPRYDAEGRSLVYGPNVVAIGPSPPAYADKDARFASEWIHAGERGGSWLWDCRPDVSVAIHRPASA